jgi:hypothetical protein
MRRVAALAVLLCLSLAALAEDVESRVLTHYVPQDVLESAVRKEGWTLIPLPVKGDVRKGDVVRIWAGGSIDVGNGDYPGQYISGPAGSLPKGLPFEPARMALSPEPAHAYALLWKTEDKKIHRTQVPGKPLEIKLSKDKEQLWVGFNDERGRYLDNHLGKGRRQEFDPLWVRIEVVRIVVD